MNHQGGPPGVPPQHPGQYGHAPQAPTHPHASQWQNQPAYGHGHHAHGAWAGQPSYGHAQGYGRGYGGFGHYEFTEPQNKKFSQAFLWTLILGVVTGLEGLVEMTQSENNISAYVNILVGVLLARAAFSFKSIVDTQGNDVAHLMQALGNVSGVLIARTILVGFVLFVTASVAAGLLVFGAAAMAS